MGESRYTVGCTSTFFLSSVILSIIALATPEWVIQELHSTYHFGVTEICADRTYDGSTSKFCSRPDDFPGAWKATAVLVSLGIVLMMFATAATIWSYISAPRLQLARWFGAIAAVVYSLASLIYPTGFQGEPVGGRAYKLPENAAIGFSYILFVVALLMIFIGELFALKIIFAQ